MLQFSLALWEAIIASVFLIPLFLYLHTTRFHSRRKTLKYVLFAFYLSGVYAVAGLPNITYIRFRPNINLEPFLYMFSAFSTSFLNVILFLPFGFFSTLLWKRFRNPFWNVLTGFGVSLSIELLQLFTFRATDINDLITNAFGTFLGWILGRILIHFVPESGLENPLSDLALVLKTVFCVMFFFQPVFASLLRQLF